MKTLHFPTWALGALVNGNNEGLFDEEIEMVDTFKRTYTIWSVDDSEYFSNYPTFGLPCMCVKAIVKQ